MTTFYAVDTDDPNITAAADPMAEEYEVPVAVMEEALREFFVQQAGWLLESIRDRAADTSAFCSIVDRKMAVHKRMEQYEKADL